MSSNNKILRHKQQRFQVHAQKSNPLALFNLLMGPELLQTVESLTPEHRERLLPPAETLSMFLSQVLNDDRSCQNAVNTAAVKRLLKGVSAGSSSTGGYCRARARLPKTMITELVHYSGQLVSHQIPDKWLWNGHRVRLVDGTTVTMPDTAENQEKFPQQAAQKSGLGFPIARIVGITCLASGVILDAALGPFKGKGGSEHSLLRSLLNSFEAGDLVIGDALYGSYFLLAECLSRSIDVLFQQNGMRLRSTDFRIGEKLGKKDHIIELHRPKQRPSWMPVQAYESTPKTLKIRECLVGDKVLITTLLDPITIPQKSLKELYKKRWNIELDIRNIKTTLGMEILSCKTPEMAEKEMWVYFFGVQPNSITYGSISLIGRYTSSANKL